MRMIFTCIILCFVICVKAQNTLDFGNIKTDSNFNRVNTSNWLDSTEFGVANICDSRNQLEIRLEERLLKENGSELIILAYKDSTWSAYKYYRKRHYIIGWETSIATFKPMEDQPKAMYDYGFKITFDRLKQNGIFLLSDGRELKDNYPTHDACSFIITFKVNNNFRSYSFSDPAILQHKEYKAIVDLLKELFD